MNKLLLLFVLFGVYANTVYGHDENGTQPLATRIGADNVSWNCSLACWSTFARAVPGINHRNTR